MTTKFPFTILPTGLYKVFVVILTSLVLPLTAYALPVDIIPDNAVSAEAVQDVKEAVRMTEDFYVSRFGLDAEQPVQLILVAHKAMYISTIVYELNINRETAEKYYYNSCGITKGNKSIINVAGTNREERLITVARELTHYYQQLLGGNHDAKWVAEGVKDVLAISVLADNEQGSLRKYAEAQLLLLQKAPYIPKLAELYEEDNWYKAANMSGLAVNYSIADAAVLYLISTVGFEPLITYYHLLGETKDAQQAFNKAFGMSIEQFEAEFSAYLAEYGITS